MKKNMLKVVFSIIFVLGFFWSLSHSGELVRAAEYINQSGEVRKTHETVDVLSFSYGYITKFSKHSGFYNGEDVIDGESVRNENFYTAPYIEVKIAHVQKRFNYDAITIYRYNSTRKDFLAKYAAFSSNDEETNLITSYTLMEQGLYKISYSYNGEIVDDEYYVYVKKDLQRAEVKGNVEYSNIPVYAYFDFSLNLADGYNLRNNKYYYAFSSDGTNMQFKKIDFFPISYDPEIYEFNSSYLSVTISEEDKCADGQTKRLYIKIVKPGIGESIICTENSYYLSNKLGASAVFFDKNGEDADEKMYYKKGDMIVGELRFNSPVVFSDLEVSFNNKDFISFSNQKTPVKLIEFQYLVNDNESYDGGIIVRTKNNFDNEAVVNHEGVNVKLSVNKGFGYAIDVDSPLISISGDSVGEVAKNSFSVDLIVNEKNIREISYYIDKCAIVQGDRCATSFDPNNKNMVVLAGDDISKNTDLNNFSKLIQINEETLGRKANGEKLLLFVKVEDKAGNISYNNKYGYVLDNVIVVGDVENVFVETDVLSDEVIVGKKFSVSLESNYDVGQVSYNMQGMDEYALCELVSSTEDKHMYDCFSVEGYYLNSDVSVKIKDIYGNEEVYNRSFRFSDLSDQKLQVGGFSVEVYNDNYYDLLINNVNNVVYSNGNKVVFGKDFQNEIKSMLGLNRIPFIDNLSVDFIYYNQGEFKVLIENIGEDFTLPSNYEILKMIGNEEKYDTCVLKDSVCSFDVYLNYRYTTLLKDNSVVQTRFVKINFIDSSLKFEVDDFIHTEAIEVFSTYEEKEYRVYNNLNIEINKESYSFVKEITFTNLSNESIEVDSFDTSVLGSYKVIMIVVSGALESYPLEYVVNIVDTTAPSIRLIGKNQLVVRKGQDIGDVVDFVEVYDEYDKNLIVHYSWDKLFDPDVEGEYVLSFWTVDGSGNKSAVVQKTIVVDNSGAVFTYVSVGAIVVITSLIIFIFIVLERKREGLSR